MPGTLFVVATPIGNLEDITVRALRTLREVALIAAEDTRRTAHLLARHAIPTPTTSFHEHNERQKTAAIIQRLERGDDVALVSDAGTPTVSDPGSHLIRDALAAGIRVEPIPGPSAVVATLSVSGLSAENFSFLGFPPTRAKDRKYWFDELAQTLGTAVFFEAPHRIITTLEELRDRMGDREVFVARELTKIHEQLVKGPISAVLGRLDPAKGEFTVALFIGHKPEKAAPSGADDAGSRRNAMAALAKAHGLTANQLYQAVEAAKKSVR